MIGWYPRRYRSKVSGPLLDRIEIQVEVPTLRYQELASKDAGEPSVQIRQRGYAATNPNPTLLSPCHRLRKARGRAGPAKGVFGALLTGGELLASSPLTGEE